MEKNLQWVCTFNDSAQVSGVYDCRATTELGSDEAKIRAFASGEGVPVDLVGLGFMFIAILIILRIVY